MNRTHIVAVAAAVLLAASTAAAGIPNERNRIKEGEAVLQGLTGRGSGLAIQHCEDCPCAAGLLSS